MEEAARRKLENTGLKPDARYALPVFNGSPRLKSTYPCGAYVAPGFNPVTVQKNVVVPTGIEPISNV
jgi:hypothetical protein